MNRAQRRSLQKSQKEHLKQMNLPEKLTQVPKDKWPSSVETNRIDVFISKKYMVQVFEEENGIKRLSINKTVFNRTSWEDNLTWDELQNIKNSVGYSECDAVEVYPKSSDVVNVANMRHLFIMPNLLDFVWRNK